MQPYTREVYMNDEDEPRKVYECVNCGEPIYEGDDYIEWADEPICWDCVRGMRKEARLEE